MEFAAAFAILAEAHRAPGQPTPLPAEQEDLMLGPPPGWFVRLLPGRAMHNAGFFRASALAAALCMARQWVRRTDRDGSRSVGAGVPLWLDHADSVERSAVAPRGASSAARGCPRSSARPPRRSPDDRDAALFSSASPKKEQPACLVNSRIAGPAGMQRRRRPSSRGTG